jgi:ubiquinone/menaquinone biosynthesis C-methylase UbiE
VNPFDEMYEGSPPWEIGRAQPFVELLQSRGAFGRSVLDVGCGTGDNSLFLSSRGHQVLGVDFSIRAISLARAKAKLREVETPFEVRNALELGGLGRTFDSLLDSAVFHVFTDAERLRYARSLAAVARPGTMLYVVCFSDKEPNWGGPRRVTRDELRSTFEAPWAVEKIEPTRYMTRMHEDGALAHLATVVYVGKPVSRGN